MGRELTTHRPHTAYGLLVEQPRDYIILGTVCAVSCPYRVPCSDGVMLRQHNEAIKLLQAGGHYSSKNNYNKVVT